MNHPMADGSSSGRNSSSGSSSNRSSCNSLSKGNIPEPKDGILQSVFTFLFFFFFELQRAFFYFLSTVSGCDGGNRTRNIAVYTWRISLRSYDRHQSVFTTTCFLLGENHFVKIICVMSTATVFSYLQSSFEEVTSLVRPMQGILYKKEMLVVNFLLN
jgi:hypothetical protein